MAWLVYIFAAYLLACYLWAMYLIVRLYTGKRLRVLLLGHRARTAADRAEAVPTAEPVSQPTFQHSAPAPSRRKAAA